MIKISKEERKALEKEYGLRFNQDIHGTFSKPRKYYLVESARNMKLLNRLRSR